MTKLPSRPEEDGAVEGVRDDGMDLFAVSN